MKEFMYLFKDAAAQPKMSADEMQKNMQEWADWMKGLAQAGKLKGGNPLDASGKLVTGTKKIVTDGPFPESKELVGGYLIVNTADIEEAVELAKGCPGLASNSFHVEIRALKSMAM